MSLRSFRDARNAFVTNLNSVLTKLNYTPAALSMKLNSAAESSGSVKSVISANDIREFTTGKRIPSVYVLFKLCDFLHITMDEIFDPKFDLAAVTGRAFARIDATKALKVEATPRVTMQDLMGLPTHELLKFAGVTNTEVFEPLREAAAEMARETAAPVEIEPEEMNTILRPLYDPSVDTYIPEPLRISDAPVQVHTVTTVTTPKVVAKFISVITERTDSPNYNPRLAKAVLDSGMQLKDIAAAVGCSTRSLRDYMYYGVTVPEHIAKSLLKTLRMPNYTSLGLKFCAEKGRYIHA